MNETKTKHISTYVYGMYKESRKLRMELILVDTMTQERMRNYRKMSIDAICPISVFSLQKN